jgi:hypothetical protein
MTFVEALKDTATFDIVTPAQQITDETMALSAKTTTARESLARSQLNRARRHLLEAKKARQQARDALLLDEED